MFQVEMEKEEIKSKELGNERNQQNVRSLKCERKRVL